MNLRTIYWQSCILMTFSFFFFCSLASVFAGSGAPFYADGVGSQASFVALAGLAVDSSATPTVYLADAGSAGSAGRTSSANVRVVSQGGEVTTLAGGIFTGIVDGQGTNAGFGVISGIAFGANSLYAICILLVIMLICASAPNVLSNVRSKMRTYAITKQYVVKT